MFVAGLTRMQYIGWDVIKSEEEENRYKMEDWEDWEKRYWGVVWNRLLCISSGPYRNY